MTDETRLIEELSRRAHDVQGSTLTLDDVRGRARSIRRRRGAAVVAVAAVVAAIVIPVSLLSGAGDGSAPQPAPPAPTHAVDPLEGGLPTLQGGEIVYPDGRRIQLRLDEGLTPDGFALLGTDRHVLTAQTGEGDRVTVVVDASGEQQNATYPLNGGLAVLPYAGAVAWMEPNGHPMLLRADDQTPQELVAVQPSEPGGAPVSDPNAIAITGDCNRTCAVMVQSDVDDPWMWESWEINTDGGALLSKVENVVDVSPAGGQLAGLDEYARDDIHVCGGVYNIGDNDPAWGSCEDNVYDFSPSGQLVATSFAEGLGPNHLDIRDADTGARVFGLEGVYWIPSFAWEGDHLLAVVVNDDGSTSLRRFGVDGEEEIVLDGFTTDLDSLRSPLILPTVA
jgi:hypothetical protein